MTDTTPLRTRLAAGLPVTLTPASDLVLAARVLARGSVQLGLLVDMAERVLRTRSPPDGWQIAMHALEIEERVAIKRSAQPMRSALALWVALNAPSELKVAKRPFRATDKELFACRGLLWMCGALQSENLAGRAEGLLDAAECIHIAARRGSLRPPERKAYWRQVLEEHWVEIASTSNGRHMVQHVISRLRALNDPRILGAGQSLAWLDDMGDKQILERKTINNAITTMKREFRLSKEGSAG